MKGARVDHNLGDILEKTTAVAIDAASQVNCRVNVDIPAVEKIIIRPIEESAATATTIPRSILFCIGSFYFEISVYYFAGDRSSHTAAVARVFDEYTDQNFRSFFWSVADKE